MKIGASTLLGASLALACPRAEPNPPPLGSLDAGALPVRSTPFGQWVLVDGPTRDLLYPTLTAFAASAQTLTGLLPSSLRGAPASHVFAGIHEGDDAASVGAMARYDTPAGRVLLYVEDTAWEPTRLDPPLAAWAAANAPSLPDGRRLCDHLPSRVQGPFLTTWGPTRGPGRILLHAMALDGAAPELARELLSAVDREAVLRAEDEPGIPTGPMRRSPLLPPGSSRLLSPERLLAVLPTTMPEGRVVAEGWGHRREANGNVVSLATRVWLTARGPIVATGSDLGPPDQPVIVGAGGPADKSSAAELRGELAGEGGARCSASYSSCKWARLEMNRFVWTLSGPDPGGSSEQEALASGFRSISDEAPQVQHE